MGSYTVEEGSAVMGRRLDGGGMGRRGGEVPTMNLDANIMGWAASDRAGGVGRCGGEGAGLIGIVGGIRRAMKVPASIAMRGDG